MGAAVPPWVVVWGRRDQGWWRRSLTMCLQVRALPDCSRLYPHTFALPLTHLLPTVPCVHMVPDCHHP